MQLSNVLNRVNEGFLDFMLGAAVGNVAYANRTSGGALALMVTAGTYAALTKLAPAHRKTVVVTAKNQTEAIANQKIVQNLINKMSYSLDDVEYVGPHGRKWTLSHK